MIVSDKGNELTSNAILTWQQANDVAMPLHRAWQTDAERVVESFNGRLRDQCLNEHLFINLRETRQIIEDWRIGYNTSRPFSGLNGLTPNSVRSTPRSGQNWNRLSL